MLVIFFVTPPHYIRIGYMSTIYCNVTSTTTRTTKEATSQRGNSRNSCQRTCARASGRCARSGAEDVLTPSPLTALCNPLNPALSRVGEPTALGRGADAQGTAARPYLPKSLSIGRDAVPRVRHCFRVTKTMNLPPRPVLSPSRQLRNRYSNRVAVVVEQPVKNKVPLAL